MQDTTYQTALEAIRNGLTDYELQGDTSEENKQVIAYSMQDIQVRDFVMGITYENHTKESVLNLLDSALTVATGNQLVPINAVRACYIYRLGDSVKALEILDSVTEIDPTYSLTTLLRRVIFSGWPAGAFESMTSELHPKVLSGINENLSEILSEIPQSLQVA